MGSDELWSPQQAAQATGFHEQTIRNWTRGEPPAIRRVERMVGRRSVIRVYREEVLREARVRGRATVPEKPDRNAAGADEAAPSDDDYAVTLEEILTRRRIIDEYREEIEQLQRKIIGQQREIEVLLMSPRRVPNN